MYEYKVEKYRVKYAEASMNKLADEGWRVISVSPDIGAGAGVIVTYEREINKEEINREERNG